MAEFQLTKEEYISACLPLFRKSFIIRCVIIILAVTYSIKTMELSMTLPVWIIVTIILITAIWLIKFFWRKRISKIFEDEASFSSITTLHITNEDFKMKNSRGNSAIAWSEVKKTSISKSFYLLFTSNRFAIIIPRKALSEDENNILTFKLKLPNKSQ